MVASLFNGNLLTSGSLRFLSDVDIQHVCKIQTCAESHYTLNYTKVYYTYYMYIYIYMYIIYSIYLLVARVYLDSGSNLDAILFQIL